MGTHEEYSFEKLWKMCGMSMTSDQRGWVENAIKKLDEIAEKLYLDKKLLSMYVPQLTHGAAHLFVISGYGSSIVLVDCYFDIQQKLIKVINVDTGESIYTRGDIALAEEKAEALRESMKPWAYEPHPNVYD